MYGGGIGANPRRFEGQHGRLHPQHERDNAKHDNRQRGDQRQAPSQQPGERLHADARQTASAGTLPSQKAIMNSAPQVGLPVPAA